MENSSHFQINDYLKPGRHAHLVGIGGVSMRPLGLVLRSMGMQISGSDMNASVSTDELMAKGIAVSIGHRRGISRSSENPSWLTVILFYCVGGAAAACAFRLARYSRAFMRS